ncbi:MAG: hypothetical protein H7289_15605 [Mucilaginibacter sp.]|nr:hypothetical protein [Mucilaginibacter sp.]
MKALFLICFLFISIDAWAQSPKAIENDIVKSYKKLTYWAVHSEYDSLEKANDILGFKLKNYTTKSPSTITYPFPLLSKDLDISSSTDGIFRIYSWDMLTGGTMHFFTNVFQYKSGNKIISVLDTPKREGDNRPNYFKMYTFKMGSNTYYMPVYLTIGSTKDAWQGLQVFSIEKGKLKEAKIIKIATGLQSQLSYYYDFFSVVDWKVRPSISFDARSMTIQMPLIADKGKVTHKFITYKLTGRYFEMVKN